MTRIRPISLKENDMTLIIVGALLLVTNLISFSLMAYDKRCARKGKWRVSEKALFIAAACFGGLGGVLGMFLCHHKTKHWYFRVFFPLFLALQAGLLFAGYWFFLR